MGSLKKCTSIGMINQMTLYYVGLLLDSVSPFETNQINSDKCYRSSEKPQCYWDYSSLLDMILFKM